MNRYTWKESNLKQRDKFMKLLFEKENHFINLKGEMSYLDNVISHLKYFLY